MVAGYVDCSFAWSAAGWARFPAAVKVRIAAGCDPQDAQVADVERGDYLPWQAVDFVLEQRAKGIDPTVYTFYDNWAPTQTEFRFRGVPEPHWWIALFDGVMELLPGTVASQRRNSVYTGADYDESIVADFWPGIDTTHGPGGGTITAEQIGGITLQMANSYHDFVRGQAPGFELWHRKRSGNAFGPWTNLGGRLGSSIISGGTDGDTLIVTVQGAVVAADGSVSSDGHFYDYVSTNDGVAWSGPTDNGGRGDGGFVLSASAATATPAPTPPQPPKSVTGTFTGTVA